MKLLKNKFLIIVVGLVIAAGAGGAVIATQFHAENEKSFEQEGYVLGDPVETDDGGYESPQIHFASGTKYSTDYADDLVFKNSDNKKTKLSDFDFAHYQDGATVSLKNGVLMDPTSISDDSNVICYNVASGSTMQKNGQAYTIDHLGSDLTLDSLAWKVGENHYIFAGEAMQLALGQGVTEEIGSYAEVEYVDNGVMQISTEEGQTFVTVSPDCQLTLGGGTVVDLAGSKITNGNSNFALSQLVIDNPDNFSVSSITDSDGVKLPTFVAKAGKDGESGDEGEEGEVGEPGAAGEAGTEGTEGIEGTSGASGTSGPGGIGSDPDEDDGSGETEIKPSLPDFTLPAFGIVANDDFEVNAPDGLKAKITITDTDARNFIPGGVTDIKATIVDTATGKVVWGPELLNGGNPITADGVLNVDVPPSTYKFTPGVEYKLTVSGSYEYKGQTYTKEFMKRTFTGGDIGVNFVISTVTSNSIKVDVSKETYSPIAQVDVVLFGPDENGNEVEIKRKSISSLTALPASNFVEFGHILGNPYSPYDPADWLGDDVFHTSGGEFLLGLRPNTVFRVEIQNLSDGSTTLATKLDKTLTAKTLLSMNDGDVKVYAPGFATNRFDCTASVWPGQITGLNINSIKKYSYEFYDSTQFDLSADPTGQTLLANQEPMLVLSTDGRQSQIANVSRSGTSMDEITGLNYLIWNKSYRVRLVVDYDDNAKIWEIPGEFSDTFGISGALFPTVKFDPDTDEDPELYDAIKGTLHINPNGVTFKSQNNDGSVPRITIQYRSTEEIGFVKTVSYDLPEGVGGNTTIDIPIFVQGLLDDSPYTMAIYGYIDFNDGNGPSNTNVGTVNVPGGIGIANLSALTIEPNGFNVVLQDLDSGTFAVDKGITGLAGMFNAFFCLTDNDANASSQYEAARLASLEFDLYAGAGTDGVKIGTAKLTSANAVPGKSTLGTSDGNDGSDLVYNAEIGSYLNYYVLTETDFGLTADSPVWKTGNNGNPVTLVTVYARRATDYTTHSSWSLGPNYFNEFPLDGTRTVEMVVKQIAPQLPEINNAVDINLIMEGNRFNYFNTSAGDFSTEKLRVGYDGDTALGFQMQAKFGAPSIAKSFTYNIYRSLVETQSTSISTSDPDEFDPANIELVGTTGPLNVISDTSNKDAFVIPKVVVLLGKKAEYDNPLDDANDAKFYYYIGDTPRDETESAGRGYTYYVTYTANLDLSTIGGGDGSYEYPKDYNLDGQNHANTVLYSRRIAAPLQKPIIKTYPSSSGGSSDAEKGQEIWKYRMLDVDGAFIANSLTSPSTLIPVAPNTLNNRIAEAKAGSPPPDYSDIIAIEGLNEGPFVVNYKFNQWRYTDESAPVNHVVPDDQALIQWNHELPYVAAQDQYELYVNEARSRLYVIFRNMSDSSDMFRRLTIAKITVTNGSSTTVQTEKSYLVPVTKNVAFNALDTANVPEVDRGVEFLSAPIELQTLTADLKGGLNLLTVEVELLYDDGHRGFDLVSTLDGTGRYAMQEMKSVGSGSIYGDYFTRTASGSTTMKSTAAQNYLGSKTFSPPTNEEGTAVLSYTALLEGNPPPRQLVGDDAIKFTLREAGAMENISGRYVVPKTLSMVEYNPKTTDNFTLPSLLPEVYDYGNTPGLEEATVAFRIEGLNVVQGFPTGNMTLKLMRRDLTGDAGTTDVPIGEWSNLPVNTESQSYQYYFGPGPVPDGYTSLPLDYTNSLNVEHSNRLEKSMLYYFTLGGDIAGDGLDTIRLFFDHDIASQGREYQFRTSDNVKIGGADGKDIKLSYHADAYDQKYLEIAYPLTGPARGYFMYYEFTNSNNDVFEVKDLRTVYTVLGQTNTGRVDIAKGDSFFNFGETYKVRLIARTNSNNDEIGRSAQVDYTIPSPIAPQFVVTTTPKDIADGAFGADQTHDDTHPWNYPTDFSINPLDPSCSLAESQYIVRILNKSGEDVTASATTGFPPPSLADKVFTFNKSDNKIQKFTISGKDLPAASGYMLNIYSVTDAPYAGVDSVAGQAGLSVAELNAAGLLVRAIEFDIHDENEVTVGDITVSSLVSSTRLIFENQINISKADHIQYSITNLSEDGMAVASAPIAFSLTAQGSGASAYNYFDLPTAITEPGLYQIEMRFTGPGGLYKEKTINYRKT
ncbi:MAG: hypothetical protein LBN34_05260 [Clostridiales Family XIII bacterium]|jgi:hypothetical protein|nr:hypothetical protein [Clostridiales Family XIII bacterium]